MLFRSPARPDLAAEHLRGALEATRFVAGAPMRIADEVVDLRPAPRRDVGLDTQALYGERVIVYEHDAEGWSWLQLERDSYVGYLPSEALRPEAPATHRVRATRTFVYPAANMKTPILMALPLNAEVNVSEVRGDFAEIEGVGFVWAGHLARLDAFEDDFVAVAERFLDEIGRAHV